MRFLLDMNLPPVLADQLRTEGHDAVHVLYAGYGEFPDQEVFARAAAEGRVVVTFDLDFGEIAGLADPVGSGVILLRLRLAQRQHLWDRLRVAIAETGEALTEGAVVLVEDARIRVRRMRDEGAST
jgi:predicted nuclease of predicted toxin-antitoxin system